MLNLLNAVPAVLIAAAMAIVFATMFGGAELLGKVLQTTRRMSRR
jgi:hypothetical protein